jgi:3-oxoadipate enol-lactonase
MVGISHGAYVALKLAATAPDRVDRLVLCSIGIDSQAYVKQIVHAWLHILQRTDLETMAWAVMPLVFGKRFLNQNREIVGKIIAAIAIRNDKEALMAHFRAMSNYPPPETFASSVQCPTLVISGSDDPIVSQSDALQLAKDCHRHYKMFPEIGHSIPAEAPALFQQVVLDFLNQP